jgi:hypothetical protein
MTHMSLLIHRPRPWKPRARREFDKTTQEHLVALYRSDAKLQAFMQYGQPEYTG